MSCGVGVELNINPIVVNVRTYRDFDGLSEPGHLVIDYTFVNISPSILVSNVVNLILDV